LRENPDGICWRRTGGPVLELASGTGRIALDLAAAGLDVTGVDRSEGMLKAARRKLAGLPVSVQNRLTLVNQDMSELSLNRRFNFIFVAGRSFQHLMTIDLQKKSLAAIRHHLDDNGRLALHLFDPRLDLLVDDKIRARRHSGTDPVTGRRYVGEMLHTSLDQLVQVRRDLWRYREMGADGEVLAEDVREMAFRWIYRQELHHLLELCGFIVEEEYSDFGGSPPVYGKELIVVARAG
jgi:ubiquinone/menaquinone biosynthesis C-methylase UbiE